jgi:hypothetical protein
MLIGVMHHSSRVKLVIHILPLTIRENGNLQRVMKISGSDIPQILLIDENGEHRGVQGSYCWGEICVDYTMPSMRTDIHEKLALRKGASISFKVIEDNTYENFHVTIFSKEKIVLHEAIKSEMKLQIPTGTYFLNAKATWEGQGNDVSNVFMVDVM